jgi:hypothetical protein
MKGNKAPGAEIEAISEVRPVNLPEIITSGRQLREMTEQALNALKDANDPPSVFVRSGELVRLVADENGNPRVVALRDAGLRGRIGRVANFYRFGTGGSRIPTLPPSAVVRDIESLGNWDFPPLAGVVEVPALRPDGTVLGKSGYDRATRLYYHPAHALQVPLIPDDPSPADIETAADLLADVLHDFPFEDESSRANAFAAMITPILRPSINGPVALALLDAPQQGTGKSLLASTIALIATGRPASMMAAPDTDEEWRKRITATLYSGANVINIDNIEGQLKAPSLASALTSEIWRDRMLGRSETLELLNGRLGWPLAITSV